MLQSLYEAVLKDLFQSNTATGQVRLRAFAASGSGVWIIAAPSPTKDLLFPNTAFIDVLNMRLGVEIFGLGKACNFCAEVLDACEYHVLGCIRQGSKYGIHNCLRNTVFRYVIWSACDQHWNQ